MRLTYWGHVNKYFPGSFQEGGKLVKQVLYNTARRCPHKAQWALAEDQTSLKLVTYTNISMMHYTIYSFKNTRNDRMVLTLRRSCGDGVFFCICFLSRCCASLVWVSFWSPFFPPDSPLSARKSAKVCASSDKTSIIQINYFYTKYTYHIHGIRLANIRQDPQIHWPLCSNASCQRSVCPMQIIIFMQYNNG